MAGCVGECECVSVWAGVSVCVCVRVFECVCQRRTQPGSEGLYGRMWCVCVCMCMCAWAGGLVVGCVIESVCLSVCVCVGV